MNLPLRETGKQKYEYHDLFGRRVRTVSNNRYTNHNAYIVVSYWIFHRSILSRPTARQNYTVTTYSAFMYQRPTAYQMHKRTRVYTNDTHTNPYTFKWLNLWTRVRRTTVSTRSERSTKKNWINNKTFRFRNVVLARSRRSIRDYRVFKECQTTTATSAIKQKKKIMIIKMKNLIRRHRRRLWNHFMAGQLRFG